MGALKFLKTSDRGLRWIWILSRDFDSRVIAELEEKARGEVPTPFLLRLSFW